MTTIAPEQRFRSRISATIPILSWLLSYQTAWLAADVIAGLTRYNLLADTVGQEQEQLLPAE